MLISRARTYVSQPVKGPAPGGVSVPCRHGSSVALCPVVSGKVGPAKPVNHTSSMTVVTPSDRPHSVRNRCVIELFGDVFVLSRCPFDISDGIGAFVIGLSQISSFFLLVTRSYWRTGHHIVK